MQLDGTIDIAAPQDRLRAALHDPQVLQALLPGQCSVTPAEGGFDMTVKKSLGFLELSLAGKITVEDHGPQTRLTITASHLIGGTLDLDLTLAFAPLDQGTTTAYTGKLEATGLAGRVLRDRAMQVRPHVSKVFDRLKARIESDPEAGPA